MKNHLSVAAVAFVCSFFCGCTSQQLYGVGESYQRNQCLHLPDKAQSDECLKNMTSYDDYKRDKDSGSK